MICRKKLLLSVRHDLVVVNQCFRLVSHAITYQSNTIENSQKLRTTSSMNPLFDVKYFLVQEIRWLKITWMSVDVGKIIVTQRSVLFIARVIKSSEIDIFSSGTLSAYLF